MPPFTGSVSILLRCGPHADSSRAGRAISHQWGRTLLHHADQSHALGINRRHFLHGTAALGAAGALGALTACTANYQSGTRWRLGRRPPQGIYQATADPNDAINDLRKIKASRAFEIVLNYNSMWNRVGTTLGYLNEAHRLGLGVILTIGYEPSVYDGSEDFMRKYSMLAADLGARNRDDFYRKWVARVKGHPALWGYYVLDEVLPPQRDAWLRWQQLLHSLDSFHPRVGTHWYHNRPRLVPNEMIRQIVPFTGGLDILGTTCYPVFFSASQGTRTTDAGPLTQGIKGHANHLGKSGVVALQCFGGERYGNTTPWPTVAQMRQMRDLAFRSFSTNDLVLWYSMFDIKSSRDPTRHWNDLVAAARVG
jgi:TAT (twin-arginine translocation) pathway signal sequence